MSLDFNINTFKPLEDFANIEMPGEAFLARKSREGESLLIVIPVDLLTLDKLRDKQKISEVAYNDSRDTGVMLFAILWHRVDQLRMEDNWQIDLIELTRDYTLNMTDEERAVAYIGTYETFQDGYQLLSKMLEDINQNPKYNEMFERIRNAKNEIKNQKTIKDVDASPYSFKDDSFKDDYGVSYN